MKKCWDPNSINRPSTIKINELILLFHKSYEEETFIVKNEEIGMQFKEAEEYRKANLSFTENYQIATHSQAIYTSRLLNPFTEDFLNYDKSDDIKLV
ncbi:uncharacterized protein OCT59_008277 [Rhizophagus irregularis]|nr:hypothetical protein OCT59_008277 [Rhizophagus irregularis]